MQAVSPTGVPIVGTRELLSGLGQIRTDSFQRGPDGKLEFEIGSEVEIEWNGQRTETSNGQRVFLDEHGVQWLENQITLVPDKDELVAMVGEDDLDDLVHDVASNIGSSTNNSGPEAQVDFLIEHGLSLVEIYDRVKERRAQDERSDEHNARAMRIAQDRGFYRADQDPEADPRTQAVARDLLTAAQAQGFRVPGGAACSDCDGKKYVICTRGDGKQVVERCDACWDGKFTDEDAAKLAQADGIKCRSEYPCLIEEAEEPDIQF
jgi:hypothetical protein